MSCPNKFWIYGPPASGKTTLGKALARLLGVRFVDTDEQISRKVGMPLAEFFSARGEAAFRAEETAVLKSVAAAPEEAVVALGGGALLNPENRAIVEAAGKVLVLEAAPEVILARAERQAGERPLVDGASPKARAARMSALLKQRAAHYASFPTRISTDNQTPEDLAWQAAALFGRFQIRSMRSARAPSGSTVRVFRGALGSVGECLTGMGTGGKVALVGDETVMALYGEKVRSSLKEAGLAAEVFTFPAGEQSKNVETARRLWEALAKEGLERGDAVLALGGGVSTDLGGFVAATYMRGVKWVALPTSLLGMVDAAIGGKTGIDLPQGKNLVGAFFPPILVLADPNALQTLPDVEFRNGMAEFIKHGVIGDPQIFALAKTARREEVEDAVSRAMAVKIRVVESDPYEQGIRASLNLGHTIGHGVEAASGYRLRHGEAVSIGMVGEAMLAESLGLASRGLAAEIADALQRWNLPVAIPAWLPAESVWRAMQVDKKKAAGALKFALPKAIGEVEVGISAPPDKVKEVLGLLSSE